MSDKKNFGYLGNTFQNQLINNIIVYKDFSNSIIEVIDPHYFDNQYFRIICQMIKEYYLKYEHTPTFDTLEQLTKSEISSPMAQKSILDTLDQVRNVSDEGSVYVQEKALKFCKQQELQKVMTKAQSIIDKGDFAAKGVSINSFLNLSGSNPLPESGEFSSNGTIAFSSSGNFFFRSASAWSKLNL